MFTGKRQRALDEVDAMPESLRSCVHEFGLPIVSVLDKYGIRDPRHIREIVRECWTGARQTGQRVGAWSAIDFVQANYYYAGSKFGWLRFPQANVPREAEPKT